MKNSEFNQTTRQASVGMFCLKVYAAFIIFFALAFTSCSSDDNAEQLRQQPPVSVTKNYVTLQTTSGNANNLHLLIENVSQSPDTFYPNPQQPLNDKPLKVGDHVRVKGENFGTYNYTLKIGKREPIYGTLNDYETSAEYTVQQSDLQ